MHVFCLLNQQENQKNSFLRKMYSKINLIVSEFNLWVNVYCLQETKQRCAPFLPS